MSKGRRQWNRDAIEWYTKALDEKCGDAQRNSVSLGNRAQAHLNVKNYRSAFDDAQAADPPTRMSPTLCPEHRVRHSLSQTHHLPGSPHAPQTLRTHARTPVCTQTISPTGSERRCSLFAERD
jgi:hypothetical protein